MTSPTPKKRKAKVAQVEHLKTPHPQHFIGASDCRFWRVSLVQRGQSRVVVSTVGDYHPMGEPRPVAIGRGRTYETFVFKAGRGRHGCGCIRISDYSEIESLPANDRATAGRNHMLLVRKWMRAQEQKEKKG